MVDYKENKYKSRIRITPDDLDWVKKNRGKKSAAGFLEEVLAEYKKPNLFNKKGNK